MDYNHGNEPSRGRIMEGVVERTEQGQEREFFTIGGTLAADAPSYVVRSADRDLLDSMRASEFCYILDSRQMGKSSLMVRAAKTLSLEGFRVVVLDLTAIGQNLTAEQWYGGLAIELGRQLGLEDEIEDFWLENSKFGPLQRWTEALRRVAIPALKPEQSLALFVDEIDAVRSIRQFNTDEFFAGIRELYHRRTVDSVYNRVTVCLLGVATPADLISDPQTTPFNIGKRIELRDFELEEALPLAKGLDSNPKRGRALLERALFWTGGHPYLTQRICSEIALSGDKNVDRICERLFLSKAGSESDDNLAFIRNRFLRTPYDLAALLDLYENIVARRRISTSDRGDPLLAELQLCGLIKLGSDRFCIRNRIYQAVFDKKWIESSKPDAEVRRQRAAFRRGLVRASALAGVVLFGMGILLAWAMSSQRAAKASAILASEESRRADALNYATNVQLAMALLNSNVGGTAQDANRLNDALQALASCIPKNSHQVDRRGFDWRFAWELCQPAIFQTAIGTREVAMAISPDGSRIACGGILEELKIVDSRTGQVFEAIPTQVGAVAALAFLENGNLVVGGLPGKLEVWTFKGATSQRLPYEGPSSVVRLAYSAKSRRLISCGQNGTIDILDPTTLQRISSAGQTKNPFSLSIDPAEGRQFAIGCESSPNVGSILTFDSGTGSPTGKYLCGTPPICALSPAPNLVFAAPGRSSSIVAIETLHKTRVELFGHASQVTAIAPSVDGHLMASGDEDGRIYVWDVAALQARRVLFANKSRIMGLEFSPDGSILYSLSENTLCAWSMKKSIGAGSIDAIAATRLAFSHDRRWLISASHPGTEAGTLSFINIANPLAKPVIMELKYKVSDIAVSPDSERLAVSGDGRKINFYSIGAKPKLISSFSLPFDAQFVDLDWGHSSGRLLVQSDASSSIFIVDPNSGNVLQSVEVEGGLVRDACFQGDSNRAIYITPSGVVGCVDLSRGRLLWSKRTGDAPCVRLGVSADGARAAVIGAAGSCTVWDGSTGKLLSQWQRQLGDTTDCALSSEGKTLLVISLDGNATLWDCDSGRPTITLKPRATLVTQRLAAPVGAAAFSADGNWIAYGTVDATLNVFQVPSLLRIDESRRNLSQNHD